MTGPIEQIHSPGGGWLRQRYPGQLGWLAARFRTGAPTGLALTVAVLTLAGCGWALRSLTTSVVHHTGIARNDPRVLSFMVSHRTPWLTVLARTLTWLGSGFLLCGEALQSAKSAGSESRGAALARPAAAR